MKRLLFVLFTHIVATQALFAQLEIETTVPTGFDEAINVGVGIGHFETIITNKGVMPVNIIGIGISHPTGLEIVSAVYEYDGTEYPANIDGNNIIMNNEVSLLAGSPLTFKYEKRATCEIVPQASTGYSIQVIDDITVLGTEYSGQSNSYPVLIPGLSAVVPESPLNNKDVMLKEVFADSIVIRNEANSGKVQYMEINMNWDNSNALKVNAVKLNGINFDFSSTNGQIKVIVNSEGLISLGYSEGIFPADSQIKMNVEGIVQSYFSTLQVAYTVNYKSFSQICEQNENAKGIMYYHQIPPAPQIFLDMDVRQKGNLCGNPLIVDVTFKNESLNIPTNSILDGYILISSAKITINRIEVNGQVVEKTSRGYELPKSEGETFSEVKGGESVNIRIYGTIQNTSNYGRTRLYIYIYGKDVSGKELSKFTYSNDYLYDYQSAIEGPGTLDVKKLPQGTYTYSCEAKRVPSVETSLLDYDVWVYIEDTPKRKLTINERGEIKDTFSTVVNACQFDDIQFDMVIKSEGCPNTQVVTSAKANVVQRCWENDLKYTVYSLSDENSGQQGGEGGGGIGGNEGGEGDSSSASKICANIYTDTTVLEKRQAAVCESINIESKAVVTYNCSDAECAPPQTIAVEFFDHNKQLNNLIISSVLINGNAGTSVNYAKQYSKFYKCSYNNKCGQGQDEVFDTIRITATLKLPETHLETTRKDANIQVAVGYINDTKMNMSKYSWGEELSIFDAPPVFSSTVDLGHRGTCDVYVSVPQTEYENVSGIIVNKVEFPAFEDSYYTNPSESNIPLVKTTNDHINQGQKNRYYTQIYPKCATDKYHLVTEAVTVWYTDFADNPTCRKEAVKKAYISTYDMEYIAPSIHLYATERQQAVTSETTWTVRVVNEGSYRAEHVMLKFTINPENTMDLMVKKFMIDGTEISNIDEDDDGNYYVNIGQIQKGDFKNVQVTVKYGSCAEEGISTINVESAWSCESLDEGNFNDFNCGETAVLELENMVAVLSAVETYPKEYFNLCEDIPIHLTIDNIGRADLNQMGFWFIKDEETYTITDNEINWEYKGGKGVVSQNMEISDMKINLYNENSILSIIPLKYDNNNYSNSDVFNPLKASEKINLNFNLQQHCSSNQYQSDTIKFSVRAFTNCGNKQEKEFQFIPKLKGFEQLDSIYVTSSTTGFTEYKGMTEVLISINNTTNTLIDSAYISVILPKGFEYIDYTSLDNSIITGLYQIPQSDGTILLQWELEQGRHLAAQDSVMISVRIRATDDCANSATLLAMCTLKRQLVDCDGNICKVAQSTEAQRIMLVPIKKDNVPVLSGQESVCTGNPVEYMIEGTGIQNITWQFSDENTNINSSSENSVQVIFPQAKTITLSVSIDGDCEDYKLTKTITVSDVPNIQLPDTIRVKWNNLNTLLDSLYTIGQWNAPFVIDECGNYYKTVSKENQCGLANKNVVLRVTDCCDTVTVGDIVETELQGITTYDAFLLRYYLKHKGALQPTSDETFQLHLRDNICEEKIVPLRECFEKRADMNKDGVINEVDVKLLQDIIK